MPTPPSLPLPLLTSLKLTQLHSLALKCGIPTAGPKPALIARIHDELAEFQRPRGAPPPSPLSPPGVRSGLLHPAWPAPGARLRATPSEVRPRRARVPKDTVLSLDMGIRNLAFCVFDIPTQSNESESHADGGHEGWSGSLIESIMSPAIPAIRAWERIAISPRPVAPTADAASLTTKPPKESFHPALYASYAYSLLARLIPAYNPTRILIERQRYRSMGGASVQEWTVRVNMFEGMLWAVLRTLQEQEGGGWAGEVEAVLPSKVVGFWLGPGSGEGADVEKQPTKAANGESAKGKGKEKGKGKGKGGASKTAKIDLVGRWLQDEAIVKLETDQARQMADAYMAKWTGTSRKRSSKASIGAGGLPEMGKLDDLADCLLQGVAWTRWQENRRTLLEQGPNALL